MDDFFEPAEQIWQLFHRNLLWTLLTTFTKVSTGCVNDSRKHKESCAIAKM